MRKVLKNEGKRFNLATFGFTLIELMGVITVLGIIALIAFPIITTSLNKSKNSISEATTRILYSNGESFIKENINNYKLTEDNVFCVSLQQLVDAGKVSSPITDASTGKKVPLTKTLKYKVSTNRKLTHDNNLYEPSDCSSLLEATQFLFEYTGGVQTFTAPRDKNYRIELWGAGTNDYAGGKGAYTSGVITLKKGDRLYLYVGEAGKKGSQGNDATLSYGLGAAATFNGGGAGGNAGGGEHPYSNYSGGNSGGGATDIRLSNGPWNDSESLKSRIMVAGGGGGHTYNDTGYDSQKGNAGTTNGEAGALYAYMINYPSDASKRGAGATQTTGNAFGVGGAGAASGTTRYCNGHSGGGGGYFGGVGGSSTGNICHNTGGGGGSSFISGATGCRAVLASGAIGTSNIHYSGKKFIEINMIGGNTIMPNPRGTTKITGNEGNGYARITIVDN